MGCSGYVGRRFRGGKRREIFLGCGPRTIRKEDLRVSWKVSKFKGDGGSHCSPKMERPSSVAKCNFILLSSRMDSGLDLFLGVNEEEIRI